MAPLHAYPSRPSQGQTNWFSDREDYDEVVENNIQETYDALDDKVDTSAVAGLNTVGWGRAVFIENGGTVPPGTPDYTIVIELPEV